MIDMHSGGVPVIKRSDRAGVLVSAVALKYVEGALEISRYLPEGRMD